MFNLLIVTALTACAAFCLWRRFTYWRRRGVPGPNFIEYQSFITKHHDWTVKAVKKYGRIYGSYYALNKFIVVNEPDLIRDIFIRDFHNFPDHFHFYMGSSKMNMSLFFMPGNDDWKRIRSVVSPAFTSGKLKAMMSHIEDISDNFVTNMEVFERKGKEFDIRKHVGAFAMDVISACAYGINADSINNPDNPVVVHARRVLGADVNISMALSVLAPIVAKFFKLEYFDLKSVEYFDALTKKIVEERKKLNTAINADKPKRKTDFVDLMLESEKQDYLGYNSNSEAETKSVQVLEKSKGKLSPDELTAQGILFFIAGYDTTSASIAHAIYYLAKNTVSQRILYEELQTLKEFTYERLNELKYLNAVIDETLRLAPSLTRFARHCAKDYKLGNTGITIPAGIPVEVFPYALHRDPKFCAKELNH